MNSRAARAIAPFIAYGVLCVHACTPDRGGADPLQWAVSFYSHRAEVCPYVIKTEPSGHRFWEEGTPIPIPATATSRVLKSVANAAHFESVSRDEIRLKRNWTHVLKVMDVKEPLELFLEVPATGPQAWVGCRGKIYVSRERAGVKEAIDAAIASSDKTHSQGS